mgnify:CR=1 FL=1
MRRLVAIAAIVLAALAVLVVGTGASSDGGSYKVRAIFDNAGFLVPGEDVKVAGVVVGRIDALEVTRDKKAAVVLEITDPAFRNFRQDARCQIRYQSLLGEKYVACEPTQPRGEGEPPAPPLRQIAAGPNKGQHLLPVERTSSPVDLDMLNNIMRLPERQRLALILNEFGTGLAGNGEKLRAAIRRANPVLDAFDDLLSILADQNRVLAQLARDGDAALQPLAREARAIATFIDKAGETAAATAERGEELERNFELLPELLAELEPTMQRLEEFSRAATPVFADLRAAAPAINQLFEQLGPFTTAALPTLHTLGDAAEISRRALIAARPVISDIRGLARATGPLARDLALGLKSLEREHGIARFMQTVLGFTGALNGYDRVSHFLRTYLFIQAPCFNYSVSPTCSAKFQRLGLASSASSADAASTTTEGTGASAESPGAGALRLLQIGLGGSTDDGAAAPAADGDRAAGGETAGEIDPADDPRAAVLGYLLGSEAVR